MEEKNVKKHKGVSYEFMITNSEKFIHLKNVLTVSSRLSVTGMTNFVVNYEDPLLVDYFLKGCWKSGELYNGTFKTDAVELQLGAPGQGNAATSLDALIYGSPLIKESIDGISMPTFETDPQTGTRQRKKDGLVNRTNVIRGGAKDKIFVIKNIDYCMDFFQYPNNPGEIDARSLHIFDKFRNPNVKSGCQLIFVTNEKIKLPFEIRTVEIEPVDNFEASNIFNSFMNLYKKSKVEVSFSEAQKQQIIRKICGMTYTAAGDALSYALSMSAEIKQEQNSVLPETRSVNSSLVIRKLRDKINRGFMDKSTGLSFLTAKPWEDYICPKSSKFTADIDKILRDFEEIKTIKEESEILSSNGKDNTACEGNIEAIQTRMPHVMVLYGKGGVGKSAFPVHFADLLKFDVWDFNIGESHNKYIGESGERIRKTLSRIDKASHVVIRIDEYDRAMGATDSSGQGMHAAHKQVEAEFMNWLQNKQEENFFVKNNIFVIMTTNHKENITGPLLRSGRVDLVIDIDNFDEKSMEETFKSAPRRNTNRGIKMLGFETQDKLDKAIKTLDIEKLSELAVAKHFTVRDVDVLLLEMAAHNYYFKKGKKGLAWNTENFIRVLECSSGSIKGDSTCELKLGDREIINGSASDYDPQTVFPFVEECIGDDFNIDDFKNSPIFK